MYTVEYYTRPDGEQPVADWLDARDAKQYGVITTKIDKLAEEGLKLLLTDMLNSIKGTPLYEVVGGQCRVLVYYDREDDCFILLHGFLKKRPREPREIETGLRLLAEYLSNK